MPGSERKEKVDNARNLLESVTLLETVAAEREGKAEDLIQDLADDGMDTKKLAEELDISQRSVESMLVKQQPNPPHERIGISDTSVDKLDPLGTEQPRHQS